MRRRRRRPRGCAFAVEVLLLEGALDLVADGVLLCAEALQFVGEALLDVLVEGLLAGCGDGRGRGRVGLGLEVVDEGLGELVARGEGQHNCGRQEGGKADGR